MRRTPHANAYHRLSFREKQRGWLAGRVTQRELVRCPACGVTVQAEQLEAHERERCSGQPTVPR